MSSSGKGSISKGSKSISAPDLGQGTNLIQKEVSAVGGVSRYLLFLYN